MQKIEIDRKILQRKEINKMEKLTYAKIANITLKIDLHNGYEVVVLAEYNENAKKYTAKFYIKDKLVDDLMLMEDFDNTEFIGKENLVIRYVPEIETTVKDSKPVLENWI